MNFLRTIRHALHYYKSMRSLDRLTRAQKRSERMSIHDRNVQLASELGMRWGAK